VVAAMPSQEARTRTHEKGEHGRGSTTPAGQRGVFGAVSLSVRESSTRGWRPRRAKLTDSHAYRGGKGGEVRA
jgi:hypothetical protein